MPNIKIIDVKPQKLIQQIRIEYMRKFLECLSNKEKLKEAFKARYREGEEDRNFNMNNLLSENFSFEEFGIHPGEEKRSETFLSPLEEAVPQYHTLEEIAWGKELVKKDKALGEKNRLILDAINYYVIENITTDLNNAIKLEDKNSLEMTWEPLLKDNDKFINFKEIVGLDTAIISAMSDFISQQIAGPVKKLLVPNIKDNTNIININNEKLVYNPQLFRPLLREVQAEALINKENKPKTKWEKFYTTHTPVDTLHPDTKGDKNLVADWERQKSENTFIDGIHVNEYIKVFNDFAKPEDVNAFFKTVILRKIPDEDKEGALAYLNRAFHQGGILFPVSGPLQLALTEKNIVGSASAQDVSRSIAITTTDYGFQIHESYAVNKCLIVQPDPKDAKKVAIFNKLLSASENKIEIFPSKGNDYVIKAGATLDINFPKNRLTAKENYISYGNDKVREVMEIRSLGQMIVDFFRNLFGLNIREAQSYDKAKLAENEINIENDSSSSSEEEPDIISNEGNENNNLINDDKGKEEVDDEDVNFTPF